MYGHLKRLIETVKGTQLVERLMCAGSLSERVKICETAKTTPEFQEFIKHYEDAIAEIPDDYALISEYEYEYDSSNAVETAIILIICGIDDVTMFDDDAYVYFIDDLGNVKGEQKSVADALIHFFNDQQNMISDCRLEDILEVIF